MTIFNELLDELECEEEDWREKWISDFVQWLFWVDGEFRKAQTGEDRLWLLIREGEEETCRVYAKWMLEQGET